MHRLFAIVALGWSLHGLGMLELVASSAPFWFLVAWWVAAKLQPTLEDDP
jgi:hypothetical protein